MIVRVIVVMNRTVVDGTDVSTTCTVVNFRVKMSCITSVDGVINSGYGLLRQNPYWLYWCGLVRGRTLTRRAQLVCDSPGSVQDETDYLNNVFSKNNYNTDFVRRNTHSNANSPTLKLTLNLALLRQWLYRTSYYRVMANQLPTRPSALRSFSLFGYFKISLRSNQVVLSLCKDLEHRLDWVFTETYRRCSRNYWYNRLLVCILVNLILWI